KVILVQDEAMCLHFSFGDYVGGVLVNTDFYYLLDNKICLIIYKDIQIIRKVIYNANNTFNLVPDNLNFDIIENIRPEEIYQIVWHRIKPVTFAQDLEC
ncbi:MAG: hypothetical protein KDC90_11275, partial [Ignavibacteriae bacterium]|nr:hypothetical protein [Ignavibacteriota bacterium]